MTKEENKLRIKLEALNSICKIYDSNSKVSYSDFTEDGSYADQRDDMVSSIIDKMYKELKDNEER